MERKEQTRQKIVKNIGYDWLQSQQSCEMLSWYHSFQTFSIF